MAAVEPRRTGVEFVEVECKSALNPVRNMGFSWSLNPYTGCEHRCSFCYVRAFELRADRPSDDRYGRTVRVKVNVASVLRAELARKSWRKETVVIGAATDPYKALKTTLRAEIDEEAWASINSDTSRPFPKPKSGRIAVKVMNHYGDGVMQVFSVKG